MKNENEIIIIFYVQGRMAQSLFFFTQNKGLPSEIFTCATTATVWNSMQCLSQLWQWNCHKHLQFVKLPFRVSCLALRTPIVRLCSVLFALSGMQMRISPLYPWSAITFSPVPSLFFRSRWNILRSGQLLCGKGPFNHIMSPFYCRYLSHIKDLHS